MSKNPSARSLKFLRDKGYHAAVVEKWNAFAGRIVDGKRMGIREDLWGAFDIIAFKWHEEDFQKGASCFRHGFVGRKILMVQSTTADHIDERFYKLRRNAVVMGWLLAGHLVEIHGWKKVGGKWKCKIREMTLDDFSDIQSNYEPKAYEADGQETEESEETEAVR